MKRFKQVLKRIFVLPPLPTICISALAFPFVAYVLIVEIDGPPAYLAYIFSAYALVISITGVPGLVQSVRRAAGKHPLVKKLLGIPLVRRLFEDAGFRTELSLYQGFCINLLYIVMKLASGLYYRSAWFLSIAVYYSLLAVMRLLLLRAKKRVASPEAEWQHYRLCGIMLLLMNQALVGMVTFMVRQNRGYTYPGLLIYAMAAYSFYALIFAVRSLVKFRKNSSPVLSAAKAIALAAAMVSLLALTTAMIARFGNGDSAFRRLMTSAVGGGVCILVLGMAIFMICTSTKQLKGLQRCSSGPNAAVLRAGPGKNRHIQQRRNSK